MSEGPRKKKYSAVRRIVLKTRMMRKAEKLLVVEEKEKAAERDMALKDSVPPLKFSGLSVHDLQELCKDLHRKIDVVDEARYDMELKVVRNDIEINGLIQKVTSLKGKAKKVNLKKVRKSGDAIGAATVADSKRSDFKANLKTVKKEEEKKEEVTDWRKNVDALSGMDGRKKMFNK